MNRCSQRPRPPTPARPRRRLAAVGSSALGPLAAVLACALPVRSAPTLAELKRMNLDDLMQTEVTSPARYSQPLLDATASIQVVSAEDIRRSTALTIAESLRLADNLNVAQKNPHDWAVSARGFNANVGDKMLVLIDGRSVYTPLFAGVFWNVQDYLLEDVARIEAISGPGGALWGANAVDGVINITTKSAQDTQGGYVEAAAGTWLHDAAGVRYGGKLGRNLFFRVYAKYLSEGPAVLESGARGADGWRQGQFGFRLDTVRGTGRTFTLQGDGYGGDLELQGPGEAHLAGGNLLARWTQSHADGGETRLQAYVDRTHLADPFGASPFAPPGYLRDDLDTYDLDFQHELRSGRHRLVGGVGYRVIVDRVRQQAPNFGFLPAHENQSLFSAFARDEVSLTDRFALIAGTKLEHNDYTGWELEPSLRARWNFDPRQTVWAAVSRAVRTPSRFDRDLVEPLENALIRGGKDFGSEILVAYELGYRAQLGSRTDVSLSTFYHDYDRLRGLGLTPVTNLPLVYGNNLDGHTHGAELSLEYRATTAWRLAAGYALLRESVRVKPGRTDLFNALEETADPEGQLSFRSVLDVSRTVQFDAHLRWVDSLVVNNSGVPASVPAYAELDVRLGWHVTPHCELTLAGQNLLDAQHAEFGPPSPTREQIRRNVYGKVSWRF